MEIISYEYPRQRRDFGKHPEFGDSEGHIESAPIDAKKEELWIESAQTALELDCTPVMAEHDVNTERFIQSNVATSHTEGAWPNEVKAHDVQDRTRYLRRITNEASYQEAVMNLCQVAADSINQNNTIDLFETYFAQSDYEHEAEPPSSKTVVVFRDPNDIKRAASKISWHPDGPEKLAVAYAITNFQQMPANMPMSSYIWDVNNPNQPDTEMIPASPLTSLKFNPRSPDHIVGGSYNGLVSFWDLRKGSSPLEQSEIEHSHHDPVYDVAWIQSRGGNECCSVSTDGRILWWDIRKLGAGPMDSMLLEDENGTVFGGTCMEYRSDAGATRYLVGSEQGMGVLADRKAKKDAESTKALKTVFGVDQGRHHGPIYGIHRNPFNPKYFLTVGDWTARVWMEDLKMPIMTTPYDEAYLTSCCWSPTRPGVFLTTKVDGTLDVWDYYFKQNCPTYSTKICDTSLTAISVEAGGELAAVGAADGSTTIISMSSSLYEAQNNEKGVMTAMFERETKREKNLDIRNTLRQKELARNAKKKVVKETVFDPAADLLAKDLELIQEAEAKFFSATNPVEEEMKGGEEKEEEKVEE